MNIITTLDKVVVQLTDNFTKSTSVNYMYKMCKKIVEDKLNEMEEYDFKKLLYWIDEVNLKTYLSKYKCIKRIVYALDYALNTTKPVTENAKFIYKNDLSQFKKISNPSKKIIEKYLKDFIQYKSKYLNYVKNYLGYYFLYLENNNHDYKTISYDELFRFKDYVNNLKLTYTTKCRILNLTAGFIFNINDGLKEKTSHIILKTIYSNHIDQLVKLDKLFLESLDYTTDDFLDLNIINLFHEHLKAKGYSLKTIKKSNRIINELLFFVYYFNVPLNSYNTLLWSKYVYETIVKEHDYKAISIKFIDFLENGTISSKNIYFNSIKNNPHKINGNYNKFPEWSKYWVEKYIAYRKKLNFKSSTISMDYNSIFRFVTYITSLEINNFNQVKPEHLFTFESIDKHSTIEGANAYLTRVRSFLIFLKDNNIIDFYVDTQIFKGARFSKKLIKTIDTKDIEKIIAHEYTSPFELRAYAIFLLGIKCGLRSVDILNLKFNDVSFKDKTIKFKQVKTQKEITLPVSNLVLNSIFNYVKYGRPKKKLEYIFISHKVPYTPVTRSVCLKSLEKLLEINEINKDYKGFHICRKTFASNIMNKTQDINITAFSLGHSDNSTVDDYVSIETKNMKECPLTLEYINYGGFEDESI